MCRSGVVSVWTICWGSISFTRLCCNPHTADSSVRGVSELEKFTPRQLEEGLRRVKTARKEFAKEHNGFEGNPAMIFKEVLGNRQR